MQDSKFVQRTTVPDVERTVTASATLNPWDERVVADIEAAEAMVITLANVSECRGRFVSIRIRSVGAGGSLQVVTGDDAAVAFDDTIEDANDRFLFYSDGAMWWPLVTVEAD
jgi:hypothetical protein